MESINGEVGDGGQPASRQKSCDACVKSKRKCDKHMPVCRRCTRRGYLCNYPNPKRTVDAAAASQQQPRQESVVSSSGLSLLDEFNFAQPPAAPLADPAGVTGAEEVGYSFLSAPASVAPAPFASMSDISPLSELPADVPWFKFITTAEEDRLAKPDGWFANPAFDQQAVTTFHKQISAPIPCDVENTKINDLCIHYEPWQLYDSNTKVHFVTNAIKSFHNTFAQENRTPFIHRHLYKDFMPQTILQCFTVCTAYANQTEFTRAVVLRTLQRSIDELKAGTLSSLPATAPLEKIARTQALLLYQTVRVFDGDVSLRALAERDMPLLEQRIFELTRCRDNHNLLWGLSDESLKSAKPESWERWIFTESVRRTAVMGHIFITLYKLMIGKTIEDLLGPWKEVHRWTLSRHLWEAGSSFDFYQQWENRKQYLIDTFHLEKFLRQGCGDDVDDFARIMLVICMGPDDTKQFLVKGNGERT